jgi:type IV secretion system protein TrbL
MSPLRRAAASLGQSFASGGRAATGASPQSGAGAAGASATAEGGSAATPAWAQRMKRNQTISRGVTAADHAIRSGDRPSGGHQVDLSEGE